MDNFFSSAQALLAMLEVQLLLAVFVVLAIGAVVMRVLRKRAPQLLQASSAATTAVEPQDQSSNADRARFKIVTNTTPLAMMNPVLGDEHSDDRHDARAVEHPGVVTLAAEDTGDDAISEAGAMSCEAAQVRCAALLVVVKQHLEAGAATAAASSLRELVRIAAASGLADQHAAARLELGELARQDGDLITACEHWQIARGLFYDLKNGHNLKTVEVQMRNHGCPTDWVLNNF